ncbi:MAG TPA: DUF305 domain-containing protein [Paracoccus sp. (in: a-proteobacteria)]|nr:DUF305 domain-containing protein [Paracoccus sp. (in: a-proteobacteria)]
MSRFISTLAALSLGLTPLAALAQSPDGTAASGSAQTAGTAPMGQAGSARDPGSQALSRANMDMHAEMMNLPMTGNADVDFMRNMIAHHRGAVAMAQAVLDHGKDPEVRQMAEKIISAQQAEMKEMQDWLTQNAPESAVPAAGASAPASGLAGTGSATDGSPADDAAGAAGSSDGAAADGSAGGQGDDNTNATSQNMSSTGSSGSGTGVTGSGSSAGEVSSSTNAESGTITGGTTTPSQGTATIPQ